MRKLAHVRGAEDVPLVEDSVGAYVHRIALAHPRNEALVDVASGVRLDYTEFAETVDRAARALMARGIGVGHRVGVWSTNRFESVVAQFAIASAGAVLVGINPSYVQSELTYVLNQAGISLVIAASGHRDSDFRAMLDQAKQSGWKGESLILDEEWEDFLTSGVTVDHAELTARTAAIPPDAPFCLQYTSGTTGRPKGATISHRAALNNGLFIGRTMRLTDQDRLCVCLPFFHAFGITACNLSCVTHGATIVISAPTFNAGAVLSAVQSEHCTVLHGVPTMFIAELNHPDFDTYDLSTLRTGLMGGAQCPLEVVQAVVTKMHLADLTVGFGMSELSSVTTQTNIGDPLERQVGTVGKVHPHLEAKIVDEHGGTVDVGVAGELAVRGYSRMTGYWDDGPRTAEVVDADGWLHSGDLAMIDEDGYVQIVGRLKDMILRGGENIYPREIEDVLHTHARIVDAYVVGLPDPVYGETVVAAVHMAEGGVTDEEELRAYCRQHLAYFKVPQRIVFRSSFPTTASGKIRKSELRELLMAELASANEGKPARA